MEDETKKIFRNSVDGSNYTSIIKNYNIDCDVTGPHLFWLTIQINLNKLGAS